MKSRQYTYVRNFSKSCCSPSTIGTWNYGLKIEEKAFAKGIMTVVQAMLLEYVKIISGYGCWGN